MIDYRKWAVASFFICMIVMSGGCRKDENSGQDDVSATAHTTITQSQTVEDRGEIESETIPEEMSSKSIQNIETQKETQQIGMQIEEQTVVSEEVSEATSEVASEAISEETSEDALDNAIKQLEELNEILK